jgi:SAM-dependent methyltransferase
MNRELTNKIRYFLEECLPPVIRDSSPMRALFRTYWGSLIDHLEDFRQRGHYYTDEEYIQLYSGFPRIQTETDNSKACLERIAADLISGSLLDVGCGTGYLVNYLHENASIKLAQYSGVDLNIDEAVGRNLPNTTFVEGKVEQLPFPDNAFDIVVCTHLLEHILDIRMAIAELRRVCRNRLIIIVPREREHSFTFNPHLHFFPYRHSFLRQMIPVPKHAICEDIGRDFYYCEDMTQ